MKLKNLATGLLLAVTALSVNAQDTSKVTHTPQYNSIELSANINPLAPHTRSINMNELSYKNASFQHIGVNEIDLNNRESFYGENIGVLSHKKFPLGLSSKVESTTEGTQANIGIHYNLPETSLIYGYINLGANKESADLTTFLGVQKNDWTVQLYNQLELSEQPFNFTEAQVSYHIGKDFNVLGRVGFANAEPVQGTIGIYKTF